MSRSCFVPVFTYWNAKDLLPLITILKCMIEYFIGPITLGPAPVAPECRLRMSTWAVKQIIPGKRNMHRLLKNVTAVVPRCWLTYAPGVSLGKGVMMLCDGLYIKLYISSRTQFKLMMDEVAWKLLSITFVTIERRYSLHNGEPPLTFGTKSPSLKSSQTLCKFFFKCTHWYQKAMRQHAKLDTEVFMLPGRKYTRCGHSTC